MAVVDVQLASPNLDPSIFSLLDFSWYSQSLITFPTSSVRPIETTDVRCEVESGHLPSSSLDVDINSRITSSQESSSSSSINDEENRSEVLGGSKSDRQIADSSEMRRVFEMFDENRDGFISGEELRRYMSRLGFQLSDAEAISIVESVDSNHDGCVDFQEFLSLYQTYYSDETVGEPDGLIEDEDDLLDAFRLFDKNHDGLISAQELQAVLLELGMPEGKSLISCQNMIRSVDGDGNGLCDIKEFQKMMNSQAFHSGSN